MKNSFYTALSYLGMVAFCLYWAVVFILSMPPTDAKAMLTGKVHRLKTMFGGSWNLFAPPADYNNRLYFIVRDINQPGSPDTIEVLKPITLRKQQMAPFNQKEMIIDYQVNRNTAALVKTIWHDKKKPAENVPGTTDTGYIARVMAETIHNKNYLVNLATLNNYCRLVLKERKIDIAGKEVKIVIKEKKIRPFNEMANVHFVQKETLVFESPFQPILP